MKNPFYLALGTRKRVRVTTLIVAGAVGLMTLGVDLTWTALADPGVDEKQPTLEQPTVDLDSLYAAKANEEHNRDTSFIDMIEPTRTIEGHVSWYGARFHGRRTANGERFDMHGMSAAHKTLPFNTIVRVEDQRTGKAVLVRINDRGPYVRSRVLDLSSEAAARLGIKGRGTTDGRIEIFPEHEVSSTIRTASGNEEGADGPARFVTFDADLYGVHPAGWSVRVGEVGTFDEAIDMHNALVAEFEQVFLTRITDGGRTTYVVSVGLFSSDVLGGDFLVELEGRYEGAEVIRFENGLPVLEDTVQVSRS